MSQNRGFSSSPAGRATHAARTGQTCCPSGVDAPLRTCDAAIDPLALYAAGIDASDYVSKITPIVRRHVPETGDLLDIGAGGGQLGRALRRHGMGWTAIEPAAVMRERLAAIEYGPTVHACDWQDADIAPGNHDTVLAANIPAPLQAPGAFLDRCRAWARRTIVWIVPAQHGPRGMCLAGCLPAEWHGENQTPGLDIVLAGLGPERQPDIVERAPWTFVLPVDDLDAIARHLADRLGFTADDPRRPALRAHLAGQITLDPGGPRLEVKKVSAVLVWRLA